MIIKRKHVFVYNGTVQWIQMVMDEIKYGALYIVLSGRYTD